MSISRKEENELPTFSSHDEAREYFKSKYGPSFMMNGSEIIGDRKIYFYHLVFDKDCYADGMGRLGKGEAVSGIEFINSYQPVEIFEDGEIHVIH